MSALPSEPSAFPDLTLCASTRGSRTTTSSIRRPVREKHHFSELYIIIPCAADDDNDDNIVTQLVKMRLETYVVK
jgi:hypothetical protein